MPETMIIDKNESVFAPSEHSLVTRPAPASDVLDRFWKDTFISKPGISGNLSPSKVILPIDRFAEKVLPPVDLREGKLLIDISKAQSLTEKGVYTPTGYSPNERLDYLNNLADNMLRNFNDIDINEDDSISKRELGNESFSKVMLSNPSSSQYLIKNFDRMVNCSNGTPALFHEAMPELSSVAISRRDLTALKALSGTEADLLSYATEANWAGFGGLAVNLGFVYTTVLGLGGLSVSRKMGVLGFGVGLAATTLSWHLALNFECNLLHSRRKELSLDGTLDEAIGALKRNRH